ncbi:MAG TPA: Rieske (2Fe-2S) protein [Chloroflexota bacterium]|nr:Rieske (2Fe-2S) protein [Chloroflexota bacterium]
MMSDWPERLNRFVEALRTGHRPPTGLAQTPEEIDDLRMAAKLAGVRPGFDEPDPAFLQGLREQIGAVQRTDQQRITRSRLLRVAGIWVAGVAGGLGLDRAWQGFHAPPPAPAGTFTLSGGRWYPVAQLADLTAGVAKPVDAGAVPAFVLRTGDSARAMSRVCTHMGCLLQFDAGESEFQCPCHGAVFDLNGKPDPGYDVLSLPSLPPLMTRVVNGTVYVLGA